MPRRLKNQISRSYCREKSNWSWWNRIIIIALVTVVHQFQCRILTRRPLSLKLRHRLRFSYQRRVAANSICYNREHEEPHRTFDDSVLTDGVAHHRCHLRLILDSYCISCKFRQWSNRFLNQQSWSFILILYLFFIFYFFLHAVRCSAILRCPRTVKPIYRRLNPRKLRTTRHFCRLLRDSARRNPEAWHAPRSNNCHRTNSMLRHIKAIRPTVSSVCATSKHYSHYACYLARMSFTLSASTSGSR